MHAVLSPAARRLSTAARDGLPGLPVRDLLDGGVAAAYEVQLEMMRLEVESGKSIAGRKIAMTSETVRRQFGVDSPAQGFLYHDRDLSRQGIVSTDFLDPKIEIEVAFLLGEDVGALSKRGGQSGETMFCGRPDGLLPPSRSPTAGSVTGTSHRWILSLTTPAVLRSCWGTSASVHRVLICVGPMWKFSSTTSFRSSGPARTRWGIPSLLSRGSRSSPGTWVFRSGPGEVVLSGALGLAWRLPPPLASYPAASRG